MKKLFKGCPDKESTGYDLRMASSGCSCEDDKDWGIHTECLKDYEIPEACHDAKYFSLLVAGLLNAYYNRVNACILSEKQIVEIGNPQEQRPVPSEINPELPF